MSALRDAYALSRVPVSQAVDDGKVVAMTGTEVAVVAGELQLLGSLTPQNPHGSLLLDDGDRAIELTIRIV